jgi:hypothetical protein
MKVSNMTSDTSYRNVPNQFIVEDDQGNRFFQSYDSVIAKIDGSGNVTLDASTWDYSKTTGKYRNQFLGENKAETMKKINSGEYKLGKLN